MCSSANAPSTYNAHPMFRIDLTNIPYIKESNNLVEKGDIIKFDAFGNGTQERFRVLKCDGNIAEILDLQDTNTFSQPTITNQSGYPTLPFANGPLDNFFKNTYYTALTAEVRQAIQSNTVNVYDYECVSKLASAIAPDNYIFSSKNISSNYVLYALKNYSTETLERNIYTLTIDHILEYLNLPNTKADIPNAELYTMIYSNQSATKKWCWLNYFNRGSTYVNNRTFGMVSCENKCLTTGSGMSLPDWPCYARPVFTIDLSKIIWTKEE